MKCRVIAAGTRLPSWIDAGFEDYRRRLRAPLEIELVEISVASRSQLGASRAREREGRAMLAALGRSDYVVVLEVTGRAMSTEQTAAWLSLRMREGSAIALLIGGPDGLAPACLERAAFAWSLSPLTLAHGLARVVLAEQLYRAASLLAGHPYHRA